MHKGSNISGNNKASTVEQSNSWAGNSRAKRSVQSQGCCRGLNNCMTMGSFVSTNINNNNNTHHIQEQQKHHYKLTTKLEQQVTDLEREVLKQKELVIIYRKRTETTQNYLRYCLQIAQHNGFLDLIFHNKDGLSKSPLSSNNVVNANITPEMPSTPLYDHKEQQSCSLASLIDQAKLNGWYIDPNEIEFQEKIGQGSTANIYTATWRGLDVAIKCIKPEFFQSKENGELFFAQELETLSRQRHRFVLQLMGACLDPPNHAWMVTELMSMTMKEWLHGPSNCRTKERLVSLPPLKERLTRALEIAQAMQYLHEQKPKVVHRDLKPSNIFLDYSMHLKVADFGHARFLDDEEMALTGETGTYVYMAPEVIRCEPYNEKCDVYSFGIILNELITGEYPYIETDYGPAKIAMEVAESNLRPRLPDIDNESQGFSKELIELICLSLDGDASIRPSFPRITCLLKKLLRNYTAYIISL